MCGTRPSDHCPANSVRRSCQARDGDTWARPIAMSVAYPAGVTAPLVHVRARYARNADEMFTKGFVSETEVDLQRSPAVASD